MKILCLHTNHDGTIRVDAGADSAILRPGEPVFPEDCAGGWISLIVPAVRISRLGTSIRANRANEYYDSFTFFHVLWPASGDFVAEGIPAAIADRTFSPGKWLPYPESKIMMNASVRPLASNEANAETMQLDPALMRTDSVISKLSEYMTFKTGDIILFFDHSHELGPSLLDTEIKVMANDNEVLGFRIK